MSDKHNPHVFIISHYPCDKTDAEMLGYPWQLANQLTAHGLSVFYLYHGSISTPHTHHNIRCFVFRDAAHLNSLIKAYTPRVMIIEDNTLLAMLSADIDIPIILNALAPEKDFLFKRLLGEQAEAASESVDISTQIKLDSLFASFDPKFLNGKPFDYQLYALDRLLSRLDVKGKDVLEIGADDANLLYRLQQQGMRYGLGINNWYWSPYQIKQITDHIVLGHGDIRNLPLVEESFDLIYSVAAFEHIHELEVALCEMHRLLKPGGIVYSLFGPLWTSGIGHHLFFEYRQHWFIFTDEVSYQHVMKPYEHLLLDKEAMFTKITSQWDESLAEEIVWQVYENPHINRYTYADYLRFFRNSPFTLVHLEKTGETPITPDLQARLADRFQFSEPIDFSCATLEVILQKE